jgi:hypothetical protein
MTASLVALTAMTLLIWQASGVASVRATFSLPFLSSQPCVMMIALLPLPGCIAGFRLRARGGQIAPARPRARHIYDGATGVQDRASAIAHQWDTINYDT